MTTGVANARGAYFCDTPTDEDAADLRRLQAMPMDGAVSLSLRVGPEAQKAEQVRGDRHHTVVVRQAGDRRVVAMGTRRVMRVYLEGVCSRVGYMSSLRNTPGVRVPRGVIAEAFDRLAATRRDDEAGFDFTSVMRDNHRARRGLERGVKGLPTYTPIGGLKTLALRVGRGRALDPPMRGVTEQDLPAVAALLAGEGRTSHLRPVVDTSGLAHGARYSGLPISDFIGYDKQGRLIGCGAVWDQRAYKQTVVEALSPALRRGRPIINAGCRLTGQVPLPAIGSELPAVFGAFLAVPGDEPVVWRRLLTGLRSLAAAKGAGVLVLGLPDEHPALRSIAMRWRARQAASVLYAVHGPDVPPPVLAGRPVWPEVAVL